MLCQFAHFSVASSGCFVCKTEAVVTFKPCGHAVICKSCAERVKKCPTCKVQILIAVAIINYFVKFGLLIQTQ